MTVEMGRTWCSPHPTQSLFSVFFEKTRKDVPWAENSIADQVPKEYDAA